MKTGAAYIRVSTEEQTEFSPDSQLKKIREYAKHNKIALPEEFIFIDEGISGKSAKNRPEFMQMIATSKIKPKPFDLILVWKFSRFARNRQDSIFYKSMLRKDFGIDVVSITEQLSNDPTSILIEALLEAMDEYYSINLAQEVKRGMNEKFSRGGVVSAPPFGYKIGKNCFEVDEENAQVVKMIFNSFINGTSIRQIAININKMGIRSKHGNKFENRTIEYILSNPVYIGKLRRNTNGFDKRDRYRIGKNITLVNGKHTPIIDIQTFETAKQILEDTKKFHTKNTRTTYTDFMLRGLIRCSNCGATLTRSAHGKSLQCNKYARGQCSKSHSISIDKINKAVLKKIRADVSSGELNIRLKKMKNDIPKDITKILIQKEYQKLQKVKLAYENGIDSLEEYRVNKNKIIDTIKQLQKEPLNHMADKIHAKCEFKIQFSKVLEVFELTNMSENMKNEILRSFIHKIVFHRDSDAIEICYYI